VSAARRSTDQLGGTVTTRQYFSSCIALPVILSLLGFALDRSAFAPVIVVGVVVYLPLAIYAYWRIRRATHLDTFTGISVIFPFASSLLLGGVFAFPQVVGGGNGDVGVAMIGALIDLVVGYTYVLVIWVIYSLLKKGGLVTNEFTA
jgi:hypothetical protein